MSFRCFQSLLCPVLSVLCFLCSFLIHFPFSIFSSGNTMPCGIKCFHGSVRSWRSQPYGCCHSRCLWGEVLTSPLFDRTIGCGLPSASPPHLSVSRGGLPSTSCLVFRTFHPSPLTIKFYIKKRLIKRLNNS